MIPFHKCLITEVSADVRGQDLYFIYFDSQCPGDVGSHPEWILVRIPEREPSAAPGSHSNTWLHGGVLNKMRLILLFKYHISLLESLFDITTDDGISGFLDHVAFRVELWSCGFDSLFGVEHKRKNFIINLDQLERIRCSLFVHGCNRKDLVACVPGSARENRHLVERSSFPFVDGKIRNICRCKDGLHS